MNQYLKTVIPSVVLVLLLISSVIGFSVFEDINYFDALWMTVTTVLTIGFGDVIPTTEAGKIFAMFLVPVCIIMFTYLMGQIIGIIVEFNISPYKRSRRMEKKIKRLNRHIIVCGVGSMTPTIIEKMVQEKQDFVLVDSDEPKLEPYMDKFKVVAGDPCEEEVLTRAGIDKAGGLITTKNDAENVLIILTAREMNSALNITSSAEKAESESKLRKAGADRVINPERIGGTRMALSVLKPAALDYMDNMLTSTNESFKVEEVFLSGTSKLLGKSLKEADIRSKFEISVMGIKRSGQIYTSNLADTRLSEHDTLIVFGREENLEEFRIATLSDQI